MSEEKLISIVPGSRVSMHFAIYLEDGTEADNSLEEEPLDFTMGDGTLIEGLERAIYGLNPGEKQTLLISPQEGFGFRDDESIVLMPRTDFPADIQLEAGVIIGFTTPSGEEIPGLIREVLESDVRVDFNHPLAGHEIRFDVEILSVDNAQLDLEDES